MEAHATEPVGTPQSGEVITSIEGAAGTVTLNRPRALNALTAAMRAKIATAFAAWARDPQVYATAIVSTSDRAFCAGGDVREMVAWGKDRPEEARRALAAEYALNWQLDCFTKPTVSLIDGVVMGSGVGITLFGTHRVAGERYRFAMPETRIGLFPDDGVSWAFARMPDHIGMYLALTGRDDRPGRRPPAGVGYPLRACCALWPDIGGNQRRRSGRPCPRQPPSRSRCR